MTGRYVYIDNKDRYDKSTKGVEVLAPAGSLDICKAVINAGADAVYLGGDMFGARAYAGNLDKNDMFEALDYAHRLGRHIYLTVNTLLKQNEIDGQLIDYIAPFYERGLDAVIVQDLGVMRLIRQNFPDMDIHASTQMTQTGVYGSGLLYNAGARRIVTSREMTLSEIKELHNAYPDMEIESFVHGAMCYCYSGQCLMSSFNGGRSGNRGRCAQPCRLAYKVYDGNDMINNASDKYALSPKDMCALKILPDIIDAGVYSLKIEGRMKNVTYAAYVTSVYRKYVDMYFSHGRKEYRVSDSDIQDLCDIYNRGAFTTGFYNATKGREMMALTRPNHWGVRALKVISNVKGKVTFKALTDINAHDVFEIDTEHSFESGIDIRKGQTMVVNLPRKYVLPEGKVLNRMKNARITEYVKEKYVDDKAQVHVLMHFKAVKNEKAELTVNSGDTYVTVYGENVEQASKRPVDKKDVTDKLSMTGQTGFVVDEVNTLMDNDIFMPVGELKKMRRDALSKLNEKLIGAFERKYIYRKQNSGEMSDDHIRYTDLDKRVNTEECRETEKELCESEKVSASQNQYPKPKGSIYKSVYLYNTKHINTIIKADAVKRIYVDFDIFYENSEEFCNVCRTIADSHIELYIGLPYILEQEKHDKLCVMLDYIDEYLNQSVCGYLVRNLEEAGLLAKRRKKYLKNDGKMFDYRIITDAGLYVFNTYASQELYSMLEHAGISMQAYTLPYELNSAELKSVCGNKSELIVYGRIPSMISKQCVRKTYGKCDHKSNVTILKQDNGKQYEVKSVCSFCYTVTRAGTFDISGENIINEMHPESLRYEFCDESEAQIQDILNMESGIDYKGHFYRGVN